MKRRTGGERCASNLHQGTATQRSWVGNKRTITWDKTWARHPPGLFLYSSTSVTSKFVKGVDPKRAMFHSNLGAAYRELGMDQEAEEALAKARRLSNEEQQGT